MNDPTEIARMIFDEAWAKNAKLFTVVYSPGGANAAPGYRTIRPSEIWGLKYLVKEPWRIIGTYREKGGFDFLVEDLECFLETTPQIQTQR